MKRVFCLIFVILAFLAGLSDLISGLFSLYDKRVAKLDTRYVIAFAAGAMLATVFTELLPEASASGAMVFVAAGFFFFYLLEKVVMIHSCGEKECEEHKVGWISVVGMAADNIVDGAGIASAYILNPLGGILVTLAVFLHEIPQGLTSAVILKRSGFSKAKIILALVAEALLYPVGALLSMLLPASFYPAIIGFVAGDFLYIAASDLLPDAHKKFNYQVVACVFFGLASVLLLEFIFKA